MLELERDLDPEDQPIPARARAVFGPDTRLLAAGERVLGFVPADAGQRLCWLAEGGELTRSELVVEVPNDPWVDAVTGEILVADLATDRMFAVDAAGSSRGLGRLPGILALASVCRTPSGLLAVNAWRRADRGAVLCFYAPDGRGLGRVELGGPPLHDMTVFAGPDPTRAAVALSSGDAILLVLGIDVQPDRLAVHELARFADLCACSFAFFVGDEGTEVRWPSTPGTLCEGGLGARVLGLEDALAALDEHRELELLDAPALAELGEGGS